MQILTAASISDSETIGVNPPSPAGGLLSMPINRRTNRVIDDLLKTPGISYSKSIVHNITVRWSDDKDDGKVTIKRMDWKLGPDK